jgi:pimeloyl-ACP methyl ester carboxylesterase
MATKKLLKIVFKYVILPIIIICILAILSFLSFVAYVQNQVRRQTEITSPNGIESLEMVTLGGIEQCISIRGWDKNNPVLLHLHGGPGTAEIPMARHFDSELEKKFVVVRWDQRGAGKSYNPDIPPETMNTDQFISDTCELAEMLRKRFDEEKVYLVGHSWGGALGARTAARYPELFHAFVGVAPFVDGIENEEMTYQFTLDRAEESGNQQALNELKEIGVPPWDNLEERGLQRKWLEHFRGWNHQELPNLWWKGATSPGSVPTDALRYKRGVKFSAEHMWTAYKSVNLFEQAPLIEVPVYFFLGRHDFNTPTELFLRYYERLEAPRGKQIVWFEDCAHMIPFEAPEKYSDMLIEKVLAETYSKPEADTGTNSQASWDNS